MTGNWARIVVVAYNSRAYLQACIDALAAQTVGDFDVRIVDNRCPENSVASVKLPDNRFRALFPGVNLGFAEGSNLGARGAGSRWVITLNPDARPHPDWLAELQKAAARHPQYAMLSSTLLNAAEPSTVDGFGDVMSIFGIAWRGGSGMPAASLPGFDVEVFAPCGAAAAYERAAFDQLGGFDAKFFCYLEDIDLGFRMQRSGRRCLQVRQALVDHVGSGSTEPGGDFQFYQAYKNNLRVILKNAPLPLAGLMLAAYAAAQSYILYRNRNSPGARARLRGLKAALAGIPDAVKCRKRFAGGLGSAALARRLSWSRGALRRHAPVFWPTAAFPEVAATAELAKGDRPR